MFPNKGGPSTRMRLWSRGLVEHGMAVTVAGKGKPFGEHSKPLAEGVTQVNNYIPFGQRLERWGILPMFMEVGKVLRNIKSGSYDVVHVIGPSNSMVEILQAARRAGAKTLYTETSSVKQPYPRRFTEALPLLDAIHGPANHIIEKFRARFGYQGQSYAFPGATDRQLQTLAATDNPYSIGYVGNLVKHKKFDLILSIWIELARSNPEVEFHAFGEGNLKNWAIQQVKAENLSDRIHIHGFVADLKQVFSRFTVLMTLTEEGQSFTIVEALGMGRQVFLPRHGCFPELYGACKAAHFIEAGATRKEVITELTTLLASPALQSAHLIEEAAAYYRQHFLPEVSTQALIDTYEDLVSN